MSLGPCTTACTMYCNVRKTPNSQTALIMALDRGTDHAFSGLLVRRTQPYSRWSMGKLQVTARYNFRTISVKVVKTTSICNTNKVLFGINFATNIRGCQILPHGHSLLHVSKIVTSFVPRRNSTTCPNAAQNTRLCILKKLPNVKPWTHKTAAFYNLADLDTNPTRAMHHEGP